MTRKSSVWHDGAGWCQLRLPMSLLLAIVRILQLYRGVLTPTVCHGE
jgi:hypothetical protein